MSAVKQEDVLGRWTAGPKVQPRAAQFVVASVTRYCAATGTCVLGCEAWSGSPLQLSARAADGMLLVPAVDDQVLCVRVGNSWLITQILLRASDTRMTFASPRDVEWVAPRIQLSALRELELHSGGRLGCYGVDLVVAASRTLVQQARHLLQQAGEVAVTAKGLLRLSGKQQLITAQEDVRVDGKRISMG